MSTNPQKLRRATRQVRVDSEWHRRLKMEAARRDITIAKLLDEICRYFFEKNEVKQTND
jgi:predicted HicB family RNase H-like nuclease